MMAEEEVEGDFLAKVTPILTPTHVLRGSGVIRLWWGSCVHSSCPASTTNSTVWSQGGPWSPCKHGHRPESNPQMVASSGVGGKLCFLTCLSFSSQVSGVAFQEEGVCLFHPGSAVHCPFGTHSRCLTGHYSGSCGCSFPSQDL